MLISGNLTNNKQGLINMEMKQLPKGLWPVMLTPFKVNNEIDLIALETLTNFYIDSGSNGLFANCLSSEIFQLTSEERLLITKKTVEFSNGKVPVVATGTFGQDVEESVTFISKLYDTGVEAVIVNTSQICTELEDESIFKTRIESILKQTGDIPLGLYECPVPYKRLISPSLMKWLASTNRFIFHKDTSCDITAIKNKLKAIEGTPLGFYNAHIPTGIESIKAGARGLAPISANLYPELLHFLLESLRNEGESEKLKKLNLTLDLMDTIIHHHYPFTAKLFLRKRGLKIGTTCRTPRSSMTIHDYQKVETIMKVFTQLTEELGIETF